MCFWYAVWPHLASFWWLSWPIFCKYIIREVQQQKHKHIHMCRRCTPVQKQLPNEPEMVDNSETVLRILSPLARCGPKVVLDVFWDPKTIRKHVFSCSQEPQTKSCQDWLAWRLKYSHGPWTSLYRVESPVAPMGQKLKMLYLLINIFNISLSNP